MSGELNVKGAFRGWFHTLQNGALESGAAFPPDLTHTVRVYKGSLDQATFDTEYRPEQYRKLGSFVLVNVPNIRISSTGSGPFQGVRVYNFTQLLLIDPKVVRTYEVNGKTYGEVVSQAYGRTEKIPMVDRIAPEGPDAEPIPVDEGYTGTSTTGSTPSPPGDGWNWYELMSGCFAHFWKMLVLLFLLYLLVLLVEKCNSAPDQCALRDREERSLQKEKKQLDSVRTAYDSNLVAAMRGIAKVYFYRNSADFEQSARGNVGKLHNVISNYPQITFIIEGHHTGTDQESVPDIDLRRAEKMRDTLIRMGIPQSQLSMQAMGDTRLIDSTRQMSVSYLPGMIMREYNQNMRVEVKWKRKDE